MSTEFCCISTDVTYYTQNSQDIVLETTEVLRRYTERLFNNEWCDAETEVNSTHVLRQYTKEDITIFIINIPSRFNFNAISNTD